MSRSAIWCPRLRLLGLHRGWRFSMLSATRPPAGHVMLGPEGQGVWTAWQPPPPVMPLPSAPCRHAGHRGYRSGFRLGRQTSGFFVLPLLYGSSPLHHPTAHEVRSFISTSTTSARAARSQLRASPCSCRILPLVHLVVIVRTGGSACEDQQLIVLGSLTTSSGTLG